MTDFVTVLRCAEGKRLAKLYTDISQPPDDYDAGYLFVPTTEPVSSLEDLHRLLVDLAVLPEYCIVRGAVHPDAEGQAVRRLAKDRPGECDAAFSPAAHHWLALDVDESSEPYTRDDLLGCVQRWRETSLPAGMRYVPLVWQWSAKAHLSPTVRGRAWLWGSRPMTDDEARRFCKAHGFDPALANPVQPHFTARPIFEGCGPDPILEPVLWVD